MKTAEATEARMPLPKINEEFVLQVKHRNPIYTISPVTAMATDLNETLPDHHLMLKNLGLVNLYDAQAKVSKLGLGIHLLEGTAVQSFQEKYTSKMRVAIAFGGSEWKSPDGDGYLIAVPSYYKTEGWETDFCRSSDRLAGLFWIIRINRQIYPSACLRRVEMYC